MRNDCDATVGGFFRIRGGEIYHAKPGSWKIRLEFEQRHGPGVTANIGAGEDILETSLEMCCTSAANLYCPASDEEE
nr:hypothetical protein CFP56_32468 [Quercus suber]